MSGETDSQLVRRVWKGDLAAFEAIVNRHRAAIVALAEGRLGSLADAEDVAQEAFVQAFFHLHELRNPEALLPWLRRTAERLALMRLRTLREEPTAPERLESAAGNLWAARVGDAETEAVEIQGLLAELPPGMQEVMGLTYLAGYTCAEAARILQVREGTVKSRLSRARARLREVLDMREAGAVKGTPSDDFTRRTIERLKREARRLLETGDVSAAAARAQAVLAAQIKAVAGEQGIAGSLAAWDSGAVRPDPEAVAMIGLPQKEQRQRECEANAAQYGLSLEELDWEVAEVDEWCQTLAKPTGKGKDTWGVPVSRMKLTILDARQLCQRLRCSPLALHQWVQQGCPILRCWPWARFDLERVEGWLADHGISEWPQENEYDLERPIRVIFREVYEGRMSPEEAEEMMRELGENVWEAPLPGITGGWDHGRA